MAFDPSRIKPLGSRVLLHKCENDDVRDDSGKVLLVLPDKTRDDTRFCKVLASGPKCKIAWPVGKSVRVREMISNNLQKLDADGEFWMADESLIEPAAYD